jgi:hypothetical protein
MRTVINTRVIGRTIAIGNKLLEFDIHQYISMEEGTVAKIWHGSSRRRITRKNAEEPVMPVRSTTPLGFWRPRSTESKRACGRVALSSSRAGGGARSPAPHSRAVTLA